MSEAYERTATPGIYRRGSRYVVAYRDPAGRQRRRTAGTLKEARSLKAALATDVQRGEYQAPSSLRFDEYARDWIGTYQGRRGRFRETTRDNYRATLEHRAIPFFRRTPLSSITPVDVDRYVQALGAEQPRLGDSAISNALKPVRALLATATRQGLIRHNPARDVILPRREDGQAEDAEPVRALTREQLAAFLTIVHPRYRLFFRILAGTGLRISEITALQWQHLELDTPKPYLRVRRTLVKGIEHAPKSRHGRRDVPITRSLADELAEAQRGSEWPRPGDPVFASETGTPLQESNVRRRYLAPVMSEIGAEWAGFHAFRHTFASLMIAGGASPVQVQRRLGHHSAAFTLSTYVHLFPDDEAPALDIAAETARVVTKVVTDPTASHRSQPE